MALLLRRLQGTKSPLEKIKLAARAWRTIRALPRKDRLALAARIGLEGAEEALERLADGRFDGRISSAELLKVLEEAEKSDPDRLKGLLRGVRDPEIQKDLLRKTAQVAKEELLAPVPDPTLESSPERGADASLAAAAQASQVVPLPFPATSVPATAPSPVPEAPAPAAWTHPLAAIPKTSLEPAEIEVLPSAMSPSSSADRFDASASEWYSIGSAISAPERYSIEASAGVFPVSTTEEKPSEPAAGAAVSSAFAARLRAAPLVSRFRLLRAGIEVARGLPFEALQEVVESFPDGWARRRALAWLLRAGVPEDIVGSVRLIESLAGASARSWCFSALLQRDSLSASEIERLQEKAPPAIRRRLRARAAPRRAVELT